MFFCSCISEHFVPCTVSCPLSLRGNLRWPPRCHPSKKQGLFRSPDKGPYTFGGWHYRGLTLDSHDALRTWLTAASSKITANWHEKKLYNELEAIETEKPGLESSGIDTFGFGFIVEKALRRNELREKKASETPQNNDFSFWKFLVLASWFHFFFAEYLHGRQL